MKRSRSNAAFLATAAAGLLWASCGYDPVPQEAIDRLPPEDGPSALHRRGQPCVQCHNQYGGAQPQLAIGGTVYQQNTATFQIGPVEGVFVTVYDSAGASQKACTNASGNFYVQLEDWPDAKFPLTVQVGNRFMRSLIGRNRSCASCHKLATQTRVDDDPNVDRLTGSGRDSAGAILVDPRSVPEEQRCGTNPASATSSGASTSSSSGSGGGGGNSGAGGPGGGS